MKIFVTSRQGIQTITKAFSKENRPEKIAIISITDPGAKPASITRMPGFSGIIRLRFDDVEQDYFWHGQFLNAMRPWQAKEIADFVNEVEDKIDFLFVHCEAGISRSAGVAAAISRYKFGNDREFFESGRYSPNMNCYKLTLEAFGYKMDPMTLEELEKINIQSIKKKYDEEN